MYHGKSRISLRNVKRNGCVLDAKVVDDEFYAYILNFAARWILNGDKGLAERSSLVGFVKIIPSQWVKIDKSCCENKN